MHFADAVTTGTTDTIGLAVELNVGSARFCRSNQHHGFRCCLRTIVNDASEVKHASLLVTQLAAIYLQNNAMPHLR